MKADLTRNSFHPWKHFTRVILQQGRPQLDADWNEQAAILLRYLQALAADLIGPAGGPEENLGFQIAGGSVTTDFAILPGHYYVDGILCELAAASAPVPITSSAAGQFQIPAASTGSFAQGQAVLLSAAGQNALTTITNLNGNVATVDTTNADVNTILSATNPEAYPKSVTYLTQPDYPNSKLMPNYELIYLDVWERLVTFVEDDGIREVALDGADTAARTKLVCQVKQTSGTCTTDLKGTFQPANRGFLMAQAQQTSVSTNPCVIAPNASYSGPENQLYRVEIHTGGVYDGTTQTFKWSRENGSVIFPIVNLTSSAGTASSAATTTVILENLGRDDRFGLSENDWVEIQDDDYVLLNSAGTLLQVQSIDSSNLTVTLAGTPALTVNMKKHPLLRRWDQSAGDPAQGGLQLGSDNAALIVEATRGSAWLNLEDGIQIQFQPAPQGSTNQYRTGDYWLIPARTATADVEWPTDATGTPRALPPDGVDHHYAPLAMIKMSDGIVAGTCQQEFTQLATGAVREAPPPPPPPPPPGRSKATKSAS